jgi:tetratricopeptide (TPR) repeat protein
MTPDDETPAEKTFADTSLRDELLQAELALNKKDFASALSTLRTCWLNNPYDLRIVQLLSLLMKENGLDELAEHLDKLGSDVEILKFDAQMLFDTGFKLLDIRLPDLAAMLFTRVLELVEDEATVHYELGFALMQMHQWEKAIPHFLKAAKNGDDFDTRLNLVVCYTLLRNASKAADMIGGMSELVDKPEHEKELTHRRIVAKRLMQHEKKTKLSARDWMYILYGTLLINQNFASSSLSKITKSLVDYSSIASTLLILRGVLDAFGLDFDVIEYYNQTSRPLAEALARLMDLPAQAYLHKEIENQDRALLILTHASDIVGQHTNFVPLSRIRTLFAYGLPTSTVLPVTPDIVGCLAQECIMPWTESFFLQDNETISSENLLPNEMQVAAVDKIIETAGNIESLPNLIQTIQEIIDYYENKKELLIVGNSELFTERPDYTAEVPI